MTLSRTAPLRRSGPLARTAPLAPGTPLLRTAPLLRPAGPAAAPWARAVPGITTGTVPEARTAATRTGRGSGRAESFPSAIAALIDARDPWCVHCGWPRDLQRHHRRIRGQGGDPRPHTGCACNGVRICLACHDWAHSGRGRAEAESEGLIIPRSSIEPRTLAVLVHLEDDRGGLLRYPSCDGRWLDAPEVTAP